MMRTGPGFFYCGFGAGAVGAVAGGAGAGAGAAVGGVAGWAGAIRTVGDTPPGYGAAEAAGVAGLGLGSASLWAMKSTSKISMALGGTAPLPLLP